MGQLLFPFQLPSKLPIFYLVERRLSPDTLCLEYRYIHWDFLALPFLLLPKARLFDLNNHPCDDMVEFLSGRFDLLQRIGF